MTLSDEVKGYLAFFAFIGVLPALYLAPVILGAITDLMV